MRGRDGREESARPDGRTERWRSHRAARREQFVDAALRSLAHGPELRVDQVAAEAGVSKPVLYRHFSDKAQLVEALHERAAVMLTERLEPALDPAATPARQVRAAIDALFSLLEEHPNLYRLVARTVPVGPTSEGRGLRDGKALAAATVGQVFDGYLRAFGLDPRGAEPLAHAIVGLVHNTAHWWSESRTMNRTEVVDLLVDAVWDGIDGFLRRRGVRLDPHAVRSPQDLLPAHAAHAATGAPVPADAPRPPSGP